MEELQKHVETLRKEGASLKQQINQLQSDKDSNKAAMEKNTAEESRLTLHQNTVRLRLKQVAVVSMQNPFRILIGRRPRSKRSRNRSGSSGSS